MVAAAPNIALMVATRSFVASASIHSICHRWRRYVHERHESADSVVESASSYKNVVIRSSDVLIWSVAGIWVCSEQYPSMRLHSSMVIDAQGMFSLANSGMEA